MGFIANLKSRDEILNLPNLLTLLRIFLIPAIGYFLSQDELTVVVESDVMFRVSPGRIACFLLYIAGLTDLCDGWLARKWNIESLLGKFLDPVADKLLLLVGLVMLMKLDRVSPWLVILLLSREFLITGLRTVAIGEGLVIPANSSGKIKLVFQIVGLGFLMWYGSLFTLDAYWIGTLILYIAFATSMGSGVIYLYHFFSALKKKRGFVARRPIER